MATDESAATIRGEISLPFAPIVVWHELIDPVAIAEWWGHPAVFADGFVPGSVGTFEWEGQTFPLTIDEVVAEQSWEFRWGKLGEREVTPESSSVRFTLEPGDEGTVLTVTEVFPHEIDAQNVDGWHEVLSSFSRYLAASAE